MAPEHEHRTIIRELYDQYHDDIFRFARYTLGDETIAYDVVQEVFIRAIRSWSSFRHDAHAKTWLLTIARNYMRDEMRKQSKFNRWVRTYEPPHLPDETLSVETAVMLEQALISLKGTYRQVFTLRHIENLSISEVAEVLGWSLGKVRMTDFRAVAKLRELLSQPDEGVNA